MPTDNEKLRDRNIRDAMYVLALSGTYNKEVRELINSTNPELGDYLRRAVAGLSPVTSRMSNTGFNTVADRVRQIRKKGFDKAKAFLREKAGEMAEAQLSRNVTTLSEISDSRILTVPAEEINGILSFGSFDGRNMSQWWKDLETSDLGRIMVEVRGGVSAGAGTEEVIKSVKNALGVTLRGAEALVRTVMTGVANEALNVLYEKNDDVVSWVVWSAILDGRTSEICLSLDGQRWRVGTPHPTPPAHFNSVKGGTMITTRRGLVPVEHVEVGDEVLTHMSRYRKVRTVMAKPCDTPMVDLVNGFGGRVSLTDDHPVLTKRGWLNAGNLEGGDVAFQNFTQFTRPESGRIRTKVEEVVLVDAHNIETGVRDELISLGIFSLTTGVSSSVELQNRSLNAEAVNQNRVSMSKDEVSDVRADPSLKLERNLLGRKELKHDALVQGGLRSHLVSLRVRNLLRDAFHVNWVVGLHSLRRRFATSAVALGVDLRPVSIAAGHSDELGVCSDGISFATAGEAEPSEGSAENPVSKSLSSFKKSETPPCPPMLSVEGLRHLFSNWFSHRGCPSVESFVAAPGMSIAARYEYDGMVFNLSVEEDETYIADSFLVHNCRSILVGQVDRAGAPEITADEWLRSQTVKFQEQLIGVGKSKVFRSGKIGVRDLVRQRSLKPLTLDEIKRLG